MAVNLDAARQFNQVLELIEKNFTPEQKRQLQERLVQPHPLPRIYHGTGYIGFKKSFVKTGEYRCPKKGEWYLSGAIPEGYQAPNDLIGQFHILKEV